MALCDGKTSWPELVGKHGKAAEETIEREVAWVNAKVVQEGTTLVTADYRCDRVWVWVDKHGFVTRIPIIG
ncbi:hypothetical protein SDJN02_20643, partial [Cucurbita argyrosperma subsp. argyrosperma]